jgi:putative hydrolase of the HAD superfamily
MIKVISFDAEGTLVTPEFSRTIWHEAMPTLYAREKGTSLEWAKEFVEGEYEKVGEQNLEWYDIKYWFHRFGLNGYRELFSGHRTKIAIYPEVEEALSFLGAKYRLIVISSSTKEFLDVLLDQIRGHFFDVFSSISDYRMIKSPDFYAKICQAMGIRPQEIVHVGDNWHFDLVIPRSVGMPAFYLDREGGGEGDEVIGNLMELGGKLAEL